MAERAFNCNQVNQEREMPPSVPLLALPVQPVEPGRKDTFEGALKALFEEDDELMGRLAR